tara:strand:- start:8353 stop:8634 length:282 start_codon:yes stop_codon:yes gene_type:complete
VELKNELVESERRLQRSVTNLREDVFEVESHRVYSDDLDHGDDYETLRARISVAFHDVDMHSDWYKYPELPEKKAHYDAAIAIIKLLLLERDL